MISAYLVHMPTTPDTHSQNTAPGPPMAMAVATPAMLPTPTVDASAVATAWNGETLPAAAWVGLPLAVAGGLLASVERGADGPRCDGHVVSLHVVFCLSL